MKLNLIFTIFYFILNFNGISQIIYNDIPDKLFPCSIDIDNDGINDYSSNSVTYTCYVSHGGVIVYGYHSWFKSYQDFFFNLKGANEGESISSNYYPSNWVDNTYTDEFCGYCGVFSGQYGFWPASLDNTLYLPIKFIKETKTHYGWIAFMQNSQTRGCEYLITSFAYNSIPDNPIIAGQTNSIASENSLPDIEIIYIHNNSLEISFNQILYEQINISITNMIGLAVFNKDLNLLANNIELGKLSSGIYILTIKMDKKIFVKKFYISSL